jgi:hypothetical protein
MMGPLPALAGVYKIVGPDGQISYSDKPPQGNDPANARSLAGLSTGADAPSGPPKLRRGLWEFKRTLVINGVPKDVTTQNCTDPITTMSFWQKTMAKVGCHYEETRRSGSKYSQDSSCKIDALAMDRRYSKTLEVSGEEAYVLKESATGGSQPPMSSVTRARRLGDC